MMNNNELELRYETEKQLAKSRVILTQLNEINTALLDLETSKTDNMDIISNAIIDIRIAVRDLIDFVK